MHPRQLKDPMQRGMYIMRDVRVSRRVVNDMREASRQIVVGGFGKVIRVDVLDGLGDAGGVKGGHCGCILDSDYSCF